MKRIALILALAFSQIVGAQQITRPFNGGTGISQANTKTITLGGPLVTSGAFTTTLTSTATTGVTLPTTGTLSTLAGAEALSNKTVTASTYAGSVEATTISASSTITPSQTVGIVGTTTNNNVQAGSVGEYGTAQLSFASRVTLTSDVTANAISVSLTAGDYDVWGVAVFSPSGGTTTTYMAPGISTVSATLGAQGSLSQVVAPGSLLAADSYIPTPVVRVLLASTTTVYLVGVSGFAIGAQKLYGDIFWRRRR